MFSYFALGAQELILLGIIGVMLVGTLVVVLVVVKQNSKKDE
jgi:hypothetical protein